MPVYNWREAIPKTPYKNKGQSYSSAGSESNYFFNKGGMIYQLKNYGNKTKTNSNLIAYNNRMPSSRTYKMIKYGGLAA
jgi:hypothetical protein